MRDILLALLGITLGVLLVMAGLVLYERAYIPSEEPGEVPFLEANQELVTVNTTRISSDDPLETAVAVSNMVYPATEEENTPGAVVLVNRANFAEVVVAANRMQHHPIDAPLLYVDEESIPELTRNEMLRLSPEGVPVDGDVQVYIVGIIGDSVMQQAEEMGYKTRVLRTKSPVELAVLVDDWASTQHGDHRNEIAIVNLDRLDEGVPGAFWNAHRGDGLAFVTDEGVPEATREMLGHRANGPWLYLFGDELVISADVARELAQLGHPRLEGLYSMGPFTFQFFWMMAGVTLGIVGAAVAALLIPPPEYRAERGEDAGRVDVDTTEAGNILKVDLGDAGT